MRGGVYRCQDIRPGYRGVEEANKTLDDEDQTVGYVTQIVVESIRPEQKELLISIPWKDARDRGEPEAQGDQKRDDDINAKSKTNKQTNKYSVGG